MSANQRLSCLLLLLVSLVFTLTGCFDSKTTTTNTKTPQPILTAKPTVTCRYDVKTLSPTQLTEALFIEKTKACLTSQSTEAEKLAYYQSFLSYLDLNT
jgi:hypothetical protein